MRDFQGCKVLDYTDGMLVCGERVNEGSVLVHPKLEFIVTLSFINLLCLVCFVKPRRLLYARRSCERAMLQSRGMTRDAERKPDI